jgi:hypothetical protein
VLAKHGFAFWQMPEHTSEGRHTLTTQVCHKEGGFFKSTMLLPETKDAQALGSALTYCKRYALSAILGIVTDEDDDGNAASTGMTAARPRGGPLNHPSVPRVDEEPIPLTNKTTRRPPPSRHNSNEERHMSPQEAEQAIIQTFSDEPF